jgi:hypothetical protein
VRKISLALCTESIEPLSRVEYELSSPRWRVLRNSDALAARVPESGVPVAVYSVSATGIRRLSVLGYLPAE